MEWAVNYSKAAQILFPLRDFGTFCTPLAGTSTWPTFYSLNIQNLIFDAHVHALGNKYRRNWRLKPCHTFFVVFQIIAAPILMRHRQNLCFSQPTCIMKHLALHINICKPYFCITSIPIHLGQKYFHSQLINGKFSNEYIIIENIYQIQRNSVADRSELESVLHPKKGNPRTRKNEVETLLE